VWWLSLVGALAAILSGALGWPAAGDVLTRIAPVLVFLVGVTVIAQLTDAAGVFDVAAREAAHLGRGRTWRLWLMVVALATGCTIVLSLDTTAVLLTPVVLSMARQLGLPPRLFAMTTVWLACTASLLLPVSNLTNLLALHRLDALGIDLHGYIALSWRPAVAALVTTVLVIAVLFRRDLASRYTVSATPAVPDKPLFWVCVAVCASLGPAFLTGVNVAWPASAGAIVLAALFAVRRRAVLRWSLLPWRLVLTVTGLFVVVAALTAHGLDRLLTTVAGAGPDGLLGDLRLTATAAASANLVDNLPAYMAMEPVADNTGHRLMLLLIGVNCGCLLTLWGSMATLLWRDRCHAAGVRIGWPRFLLYGLVLVPVVLAAAVLATRL
jgi:arsenical pump membrane protein